MNILKRKLLKGAIATPVLAITPAMAAIAPALEPGNVIITSEMAKTISTGLKLMELVTTLKIEENTVAGYNPGVVPLEMIADWIDIRKALQPHIDAGNKEIVPLAETDWGKRKIAEKHEEVTLTLTPKGTEALQVICDYYTCNQSQLSNWHDSEERYTCQKVKSMFNT